MQKLVVLKKISVETLYRTCPTDITAFSSAVYTYLLYGVFYQGQYRSRLNCLKKMDISTTSVYLILLCYGKF